MHLSQAWLHQKFHAFEQMTNAVVFLESLILALVCILFPETVSQNTCNYTERDVTMDNTRLTFTCMQIKHMHSAN